jgi:hypothetical protein
MRLGGSDAFMASCPYKQEVAGSSPAPPTRRKPCNGVECAGSPAFRSGRSGGHGKGRGQACGHGSAQIGIASAWIALSRSGARVRVAPSLRTPCTCAGFVFRGSPWIGRDPAPFQALVPEIAAIAADCRGFAAIRVRLGDRPELWSPPSISAPGGAGTPRGLAPRNRPRCIADCRALGRGGARLDRACSLVPRTEGSRPCH